MDTLRIRDTLHTIAAAVVSDRGSIRAAKGLTLSWLGAMAAGLALFLGPRAAAANGPFCFLGCTTNYDCECTYDSQTKYPTAMVGEWDSQYQLYCIYQGDGCFEQLCGSGCPV